MRGRSSIAGNEKALRAMLAAESDAGRLHLAGIAVSFATGMAELSGRRMCERAIALRQDAGMPDPQILVLMNEPRRP